MRSTFRLLPLVIFLVAFAPALAQARPGDLFVGDPGSSQVLRISHKTAHQKVVASGHDIADPDSGAFDDKGRLVISDYAAFQNHGAIFRINVGSGGVQTLASGAPFGRGPTDVAITPNGKIYTVDSGAAAVFRIDPKSGGRHIVAQGGDLKIPVGIAALSNRKLLISDAGTGIQDGAMIVVNVKTGHTSFVVQRGDLLSPYGFALSPTGKSAYVVSSSASNPTITRVNVKTGAQKLAAHGAPLDDLTDVAMGLNGKLYAVDDSPSNPAIVKVNPKTGHARIFAQGGKLDAPEGITVQPPTAGHG